MNNASTVEALLRRIEEKAGREHIPIVQPEVAKLLEIIIKIQKPYRILEIGTAIGYSTILMAQAAGPDTEIVSIEIDEDRAQEALNNFQELGIEKQINLKLGDAVEILPLLKRKFPLVFIDGAKGQYPYYLDAVMDLLPSGGVIFADNVFYKGYVCQQGPIKHKRRTIVNNLREFIRILQEHPLLDTRILPWGDGIALSVRR